MTDPAQEILDMLKRRKAELVAFMTEFAGDKAADDYIASCLLSLELTALIFKAEAIIRQSQTLGARLQ